MTDHGVSNGEPLYTKIVPIAETDQGTNERRQGESFQTKAYSSEKYTQIVLISLVATANQCEIRQCVIAVE
jgi:hypothetical protein